MKMRIIFFGVLFYLIVPAFSQVSDYSEKFNYHEHFCKEDQVQQLKQRRGFWKNRSKDAKVLWAQHLAQSGLISYNDTFSKFLNYHVRKLLPLIPGFNIEIATIKSPQTGFISVSKKLVLVYSGNYGCLKNDSQLFGLLMLLVTNHLSNNYQTAPEVSSESSQWMLHNPMHDSDYHKAAILWRKLYPNNVQKIPDISKFSMGSEGIPEFREGPPEDHYLTNIGLRTRWSMFFQDGRYDDAIGDIFIHQTLKDPFLVDLLMKCFYMKTLDMVQHPYYHRAPHNFFNPDKHPLSDTAYFENLLSLMLRLTLHSPTHISRAIFYQTISLEAAFLNISIQAVPEKPGFGSKVLHLALERDTGWNTFLGNLQKYSWYQNHPKIYIDSIQNSQFTALLPASSKLQRGQVLIISREPFLLDTLDAKTRKKQWSKLEHYALGHLTPKIDKTIATLVGKSKNAKPYLQDHSILAHGDLCRHTTEINEAGLQLPFVTWLTRSYDSGFYQKNIHYIIYIQTALWSGNRNAGLKRRLLKSGFPVKWIYNKFISSVDVYDLRKNSYIYSSKRLIDYHGTDLFLSNLYDQLLPLIQ